MSAARLALFWAEALWLLALTVPVLAFGPADALEGDR